MALADLQNESQLVVSKVYTLAKLMLSADFHRGCSATSQHALEMVIRLQRAISVLQDPESILGEDMRAIFSKNRRAAMIIQPIIASTGGGVEQHSAQDHKT